MFTRRSTKDDAGSAIDCAALIARCMALSQRQAPCMAACMRNAHGTHTGTLLLAPQQLLFFVGSGGDPADVLCTLPYAAITDWGTDLLRGTGGVPALTVDHGKQQTHFEAPPDAADSAPEWAASAMIYLDLVVLRWMAGMEEAKHTALLDQVQTDKQDVDVDTLLFDRRALRVPEGIDAAVRTIGGHRFPCRWVVYLHGLKGLVHAQETEIPCLCIPSDMGFLVMLPQQKVFLPLYWREIPSFGSRKSAFTFKHVPCNKPGHATTFVFHLDHAHQHNAGQLLEADVRVALKHSYDRLKDGPLPAFPMAYPPMKAGAQALKAAVSEDDVKRLERTVTEVAASRSEVIRTQLRSMDSSSGDAAAKKREQFTMRFLSAALDIGGVDGEEEADAAYLEMIDEKAATKK